MTKKEGNVFANLKFPDLNIPRNLNGFIARDYHHSLLCVGKTGQPVVGFGYVPDIFWLDNKGKWQQKTVNSCLVDSNKLTLFPDRYKAPQNDFSLAMYSHLYFLKAAKKYIRAVRLPDADSSQRYQRFGNEPRFSFILFDIDNQKIKIEAEGILPAQFAGALAFFDDKGVWLWNKEKSMKEKKMFLQYFSFEFEKLASPAELKKRLSVELK